MSDIRPYGVTQHADAEMVTANQLVGDRLDHPTVNAVGGGPALFSTAPYRTTRMCAKDSCGNYHLKGSAWCRWHEPATAP